MHRDVDSLYHSLKGIVEGREGKVEVVDRERFIKGLDDLVREGVFNPEREVRGHARWIIRSAALSDGIHPSSIINLYDAMGREEVGGFTVPAINIRGLTYDMARAVFRAAMEGEVGAFIFEIARSEMGYTDQSPSEYSAVIMAAALREGFRGPVFIQGDHFQVKRDRFKGDREAEIEELKALIRRSIASGFYNIDIDASTLVDLEKEGLVEQQRDNFEITALFTDYIRSVEPEGITITIGGEIGEVGGKNSTPEELRAFMDGYLSSLGKGVKGLSKISVQTGTTHGGVVLPDGSIARVKIDFDTLERLSKIARKEYGLAGCVQHGASTLPDEAFHLFPEKGTAEIHLATAFQNMVYDDPSFPHDLREEIYSYLKEKHKGEWKEGETEEQFIYKTRKKAFGPFKKRFWDLPEAYREGLRERLKDRFLFLFEKLKVFGTKEIVDRWVKPLPTRIDLQGEIENS